MLTVRDIRGEGFVVRHRRSSPVFGCLCAVLAVSMVTVRVPYYAIFAAVAMLAVLVAWVVVLSRSGRHG
jgi:hypothetical protein